MIDLGKIEQVAHLARISLTEEEKVRFVKELESVFGWVDQLESVPLKEIDPDPLISMPMRADIVAHDITAQDILANAPSQDQNMFLVPRVL